MNTKKILAVSLAATTAFSMFGAAMSVGAAVTRTDIEAYKSTYDTSNGPHAEYTVLSMTTAANEFTLDGVTMTTMSNDDMIDLASKFIWDKDITVEKGYVYLYDYKADGNSNDADKTALETVLNKLVSLPSKSSGYDAGSSGYATAQDAAAALSIALANYYQDGTVGAMNPEDTGVSTVTNTRLNMISTLNTYITKAKDFKPADYLTADIEGYNVVALMDDIKAADNTTETSLINYYVKEYDRLLLLLGAADTTTKEDTYYKRLDRVESLQETDYTIYNWNDVEKNLKNAVAYAEKGKWDDANKALAAALAVVPEKATYTELQNLLMNMYDNDGKISASYIKKDYTNASTLYTIYKSTDYRVGSSYTPAWKELFSETFEYDLNRDGEADDHTGVYDFAYEVYNRASRNIRVGQSTVDYAVELLTGALDSLDPSSSATDWAVLKLEKAIEIASALNDSDFNTTSRDFKTMTTALAKAETVLSKASASKSEVTAAFNGLNSATIALASSAAKRAIPYATTKAMNDTYKAAVKLYESAISDKVTGAQVLSLKKAIDKKDAGKYNTVFDVEGNTSATLISNVEGMTAELKTAIAGFEQPQGWYQDGGKWMYGENDSFYVDGWKQINKTWFYFNADGTAKQSEWFQMDGNWYYANSNCGLATGWAKVDGKWYFFKGNNAMKTGWEKVDGQWYYMNASGAMVTGWAQINGKYYYFSKASNALGQMAVNTTIDGYKIDANGVWVK